jgi:pyrroloquinoline quinone biosynthesis protein B
MAEFLGRNGPWDQLVRLQNIELRRVEPGTPVQLNSRLRAIPIPVPHRDEYTETAGWRIEGPSRSALFIPDIDKWERWDLRIEDLLAEVDVAYLDGTFFADGEVPGRDMAEIPHPFIVESLERFAALPPQTRSKVRFVHLNHTNPVLLPDSSARRRIEQAGCHVAEELERFGL